MKLIAILMSTTMVLVSCSQASSDSSNANTTTASSSSSILVQNPLFPVSNMRGSYSSFGEWKSLFKSRALDAGISEETFASAEPFMQFRQRVVNNDRNQAEVQQTTMYYVNQRVSQARINLGRQAVSNYGGLIDRISRQYNVDKSVIVGIWGMETNYGNFFGGINVFEALATLSYEGRRRDWAEKQLINALYIVQNGDKSPAQMEGSWASGMGHTQFIPQSYNTYAVDYNGDGKRDLWNHVDALASTANYLRGEDFVPGVAWGAEVRLPADFNYNLADKDSYRSREEWVNMGVQSLSSRGLPDAPLAIYIPEGANGRAFAVTKNFHLIRRYNPSYSYALGVALLGDKVLGY